jgi:replicative DNA helicase
LNSSNTISNRCFEDRGEVERVIEFAQSAIFELSEGKTKQAFFPLSQIIETNIDALEERQGNRALVTGVTTGFSKLDALTSGFQNSDLIILAARPAMGKTAFALNMARNAAIEGGVPVAIFSLEMSKEQLSMRMLCAEARVDSSRIRSGFLNQEDWNRITDAADRLTAAPLFIDDSPDISTTSIRTKSMRMKMDKGLGLIIIDYLQLMRGNTNIERRDLEISDISRSLKILAKELNLPVVALSQLNRKLEERSDKRPQLSDLRESGALEQDADLVAFIYRDEVYNRDENNPIGAQRKSSWQTAQRPHRQSDAGLFEILHPVRKPGLSNERNLRQPVGLKASQIKRLENLADGGSPRGHRLLRAVPRPVRPLRRNRPADRSSHRPQREDCTGAGR